MKGLVLIMWMVITFLLVISVIGLWVVTPTTTHYVKGPPDIQRSDWMTFGDKLLNSFLNGK